MILLVKGEPAKQYCREHRVLSERGCAKCQARRRQAYQAAKQVAEYVRLVRRVALAV